MRYYQNLMPMEGSRDNRRRNLSGSCSLTVKYPAQNERFGIYGIFKGKEQLDDISKIREHEVCIPKPRILV